MSTTRAIPSCGLSDSDLLFTQGNGDILPDLDFNATSHSNSQCNSNSNSISNSNSNETNLINSNCNVSSVNLQENIHQLNFLECGDENMFSELIEVTEEYMHKMQKATTIVPSNLQDGNDIIKFSQTMKCFGEFLVTNGNKLHFPSGKLITNLSGDCQDGDLEYTNVDKPVSEDTTADRNLDKFTEKNNDKSIVNIQESGSTSLHSSVDSFSIMILTLQISCLISQQTTQMKIVMTVITYLNKKKAQVGKIIGVKVMTQIQCTLVISALKLQNQNNQ